MQQEVANKKQTALDKKQAAMNKKVATLEAQVTVMSKELSVLKPDLSSQLFKEAPSSDGFTATQPPESTKKSGNSSASSNPLGSAEFGDKSDDEPSLGHGSTSRDDAKRPASAQSEKAGNDEDSSSDDEAFKAVQKALGKKK